jgi:ribosome recycling factor
METIEKNLCKIQEKMEKSFQHFKESLSKIRAGTANASIDLLNTIKVYYNGIFTPLNGVANVNVINAMTLTIQPWDRRILSSIYKSLIKTNLGFTPINNGEVIFIYLPPLTEERRKELIKKAKVEIEKGKISIRTLRKDANHSFKKKNLSEDLFKRYENSLQKLTNLYIKKIDETANIKEKEILNI